MLRPRFVPCESRIRRGDTAKVVIIIVASLFGLFLLLCAGAGVAGYLWWQKNFARAMLTNPQDIRTLTAEMVDITLPPEFQPQHGSEVGMIGMKVVSYRWCPSGTCPPLGSDDDINTLTLTMLNANSNDAAGGDYDEFEFSMSDESLKETYVNYTKEVRDFTIGGKECKFYFVTGEMRDWSEMDEEMGESEMPQNDVKEVIAPDAAEPEPTVPDSLPAKGTGKPVVAIQGAFPGKGGQVTLNIHMSADNYDEEKILAVLQSIR